MRVLGKIKKMNFFFPKMIIASFSNYAFWVNSITYFPYLKFMSNLKNNSINVKFWLEQTIPNRILQCFQLIHNNVDVIIGVFNTQAEQPSRFKHFMDLLICFIWRNDLTCPLELKLFHPKPTSA